MRIITPMKLNPTPIAFFPVIGSFKKIAANIIVKIGPRDVSMELSMELAIVIPFKKVYCGITRPIIAAIAISPRSFLHTFSLGQNMDTSQNTQAAHIILIPKRASGVMTEAFDMSLQKTMLSPNIV